MFKCAWLPTRGESAKGTSFDVANRNRLAANALIRAPPETCVNWCANICTRKAYCCCVDWCREEGERGSEVMGAFRASVLSGCQTDLYREVFAYSPPATLLHSSATWSYTGLRVKWIKYVRVMRRDSNSTIRIDTHTQMIVWQEHEMNEGVTKQVIDIVLTYNIYFGCNGMFVL